MKIFITMEIEEILNQIDPSAIREYVRNENIYIDQDRDPDEIWEDLELHLEKESKKIAIFVEDRVDSRDLLKRIGELMEQIRVSGCMDKVIELLTIKYNG